MQEFTMTRCINPYVFLLIPAIVIAITMVNYAGAQPYDYQEWHGDTNGITLFYPEGWSIDEKPETYYVPCVLEAPSPIDEDDFNERDPFGAFIMPVYIGEGYFEDIDSLAKAWKKNIRNDWVEFEIASESKSETEEGHPAYEMQYMVTDEKDYRIEWSVWLVLTSEKKRAWVIGYCARDEFQTHYPEAREIFKLAKFED
jgi:hypothetical protein